jgi:hypothetical protein
MICGLWTSYEMGHFPPWLTSIRVLLFRYWLVILVPLSAGLCRIFWYSLLVSTFEVCGVGVGVGVRPWKILSIIDAGLAAGLGAGVPRN